MQDKAIEKIITEKNNYLPLEKYTLKKDLGVVTEAHRENIDCKAKEFWSIFGDSTLYLYNYNNRVIVARNDPILVLCRGLVLTEEGTVIAYAMPRFFNHFEKEACKEFDWEPATLVKKYDGSLIILFYFGDWRVITRGSWYPLENQRSYINFETMFREEFQFGTRHKNWSKLSSKYTYWFELCTEKNRIVTWYDKPMLLLLGMRNRKTGQEVPIHEVKMVAKSLEGVKYPVSFKARTIAEAQKGFDKLNDDEEGFVAVDKNFNRIKIKQESYFALSKIKTLGNQEILDYVRGKIPLDAELLELDPEISKAVTSMKDRIKEFNGIVDQIFNELSTTTNSRKEFAKYAAMYPFSDLLFRRLSGKNIDKISYEMVLTTLANKQRYEEDE